MTSHTLDIYAVVAGTISAFCWARSAFASVSSEAVRKRNTKDGWTAAQISSDGKDVLKTIKKQSYWNGWAAGFAALTAIFQILSVAIKA